MMTDFNIENSNIMGFIKIIQIFIHDLHKSKSENEKNSGDGP